MNTCWKCRATLRVSDAAFCPVCGISQKRDGAAPPVISGVPTGATQSTGQANWGTRISGATEQPGWGLAIVWTVLFPLAPFTYPILLLASNTRLRRHVAGALASPGMQSPRVTQTPEGRAIRERLAVSTGALTTAGVLPFLLSILLLLICSFCLFIIPAQAPRLISYERAMESVLEAETARGYIYINSAADYEAFWSNHYTWSYDDITLSTTNYTRDGTYIESEKSGIPQYEKSTQYVTSYEHPPYEYITGDHDGRNRYNRVSSLSLHWDTSKHAGVMFWIATTGLYLTNLIFGLVFWFRFMRHREAEVLAAAFVVGDPGLHDRLLPLVQQRNALLAWVIIPLSLTGLHMFALPLLRTAVFARHAEWEARSGILAALPARRA